MWRISSIMPWWSQFSSCHPLKMSAYQKTNYSLTKSKFLQTFLIGRISANRTRADLGTRLPALAPMEPASLQGERRRRKWWWWCWWWRRDEINGDDDCDDHNDDESDEDESMMTMMTSIPRDLIEKKECGKPPGNPCADRSRPVCRSFFVSHPPDSKFVEKMRIFRSARASWNTFVSPL